MSKKEYIEIPRAILNNAISMNMSPEIILKISQKIDKYIIEYYKQNLDKEGEGDG